MILSKNAFLSLLALAVTISLSNPSCETSKPPPRSNEVKVKAKANLQTDARDESEDDDGTLDEKTPRATVVRIRKCDASRSIPPSKSFSCDLVFENEEQDPYWFVLNGGFSTPEPGPIHNVVRIRRLDSVIWGVQGGPVYIFLNSTHTFIHVPGHSKVEVGNLYFITLDDAEPLVGSYLTVETVSLTSGQNLAELLSTPGNVDEDVWEFDEPQEARFVGVREHRLVIEVRGD